VTTRPRVHEWAWGDVGRRTVCGLVGFGVRGRAQLARMQVVHDLGPVEQANRCRNCERMRAAIGASSRPVTGAEPIFPTIVNEEALGAAAGELTERERHIIEHSTGWLSRWPLYRNHFCAGPSHDDWRTIQDLVARGLMKVSRMPSPLSGGDVVFCVTAVGIAALKRSAPAQSGGARQPGANGE
jgi:hypothetical protein